MSEPRPPSNTIKCKAVLMLGGLSWRLTSSFGCLKARAASPAHYGQEQDNILVGTAAYKPTGTKGRRFFLFWQVVFKQGYERAELVRLFLPDAGRRKAAKWEEKTGCGTYKLANTPRPLCYARFYYFSSSPSDDKCSISVRGTWEGCRGAVLVWSVLSSVKDVRGSNDRIEEEFGRACRGRGGREGAARIRGDRPACRKISKDV
ncbi:uncharacterized protein BDZ99DRAFT_199732 [Mytilinidion resinicola]|uniref:Uncharacterized protein n=1 Tax=Mytilinidion resinicola TaxID=574789 RepID=A0A6A6Y1T7_9PEZI|nr:uncharacterized protein BDZ99DRAFT_199732 [Mytilinidion resinicola]KAF2802781.1 hypothetical protein BDZ99DRAFT_199732 [Mytilinidion resinicola]